MGSKRKIDSNQVKILLSDTILALCRNTLNQYGEVAVEGLLGITLDKEEIFLVSLHEVIQNKSDASKQSTGSSRKHKHSDWSSAVSEDDSDSDSTSSRSKRKRRKKRKRSRSSDSISEKGSKGSKSDGEMNSRKSHSGSRSSQVIVKEEVIDEDEIIVTKENIRRKDNSDVASFHSSGAEYSDQALMNPPAFIIDPQMAQFQASPSMTNTMAQAGSSPVLFPVRRRDVLLGRTCPFCQKVFAAPSNLRDHVRTHTGERPYKCAICGRAFTQKFHMQRHMARLHNIPMPKQTAANSSALMGGADPDKTSPSDHEKSSPSDHDATSNSDHDKMAASLFYTQHFFTFADASHSGNFVEQNNSEDEDDES